MLHKKFAFLLTIVLLCCCFTMPATVEAQTVFTAATADEFKTRLSAADSGDTLQLTANITLSENAALPATGSAKSFTLDLNGYSLTYTPAAGVSSTEAITINATWNVRLVNSGATPSAIVNNSDATFFKTNGSSTLTVSGNFSSEISNNNNITFENCVVDGNVRTNACVVTDGKSLTITGNLSCGDRLEMKTDSVVHIDGATTLGRRATIYPNAYFGGDVTIAKDFTYNSGDRTTTDIYGGTFKGKLSVADNVTFKYASASYTVNISGGKFYDTLRLCYPSDTNLGKLNANITKGNFYKNAVIDCEVAKITGGNFSYTFLDEDNTELKSLLVRYNADIIEPTHPQKDGYTFTGWSGFTEGMKADRVYQFTAVYKEGDDPNEPVVINTPVAYTADGVAIEGALDIYTSVAEPGKTFDDSTGALKDDTSIYGLTDYIPVENGDRFRLSSIKTDVYKGASFAAAYDADKNFLGVFVHNAHKNMSFIGRYKKQYSIGVIPTVSPYGYALDVEFQVPISEEKSLFQKIAYIRVKAFKSNTIAKEDFYLAYLGNEEVYQTDQITNLPAADDPNVNTPLSETMGDLNGDGKSNAKDILYLRQHLASMADRTVGLCNADVNFDGKINVKDVLYYRRSIANWPDYEIQTDAKYIALSFDDAPGSMSATLDTLEKYKDDQVRATYMINGSRVSGDTNYSSSNTSLLARADEMGIQLGNHSTFHENVGSYSVTEIMQDINFTQDIIKEATGQTNKYFRAPYFSTNAWMGEVLSDMVFIEGTQSSDTTTTVTAEQSAERQLSQAKSGNIVLLHDNNKLADTLDIMIPALLADGYKLVTVDELFRYCNVKPEGGYVYTNVLSGKKPVS